MASIIPKPLSAQADFRLENTIFLTKASGFNVLKKMRCAKAA